MTTGSRLQVNVSLTYGSHGGDRPGKSFLYFKSFYGLVLSTQFVPVVPDYDINVFFVVGIKLSFEY